MHGFTTPLTYSINLFDGLPFYEVVQTLWLAPSLCHSNGRSETGGIWQGNAAKCSRLEALSDQIGTMLYYTYVMTTTIYFKFQN